MATKTSTKRLDLLKQDNQSKEAQQLEFQVKKDKLQLEADLLETKLQLESKKQQLLQLKSAAVLSPASIINCQNELISLAAGVKALENLDRELF